MLLYWLASGICASCEDHGHQSTSIDLGRKSFYSIKPIIVEGGKLAFPGEFSDFQLLNEIKKSCRLLHCLLSFHCFPRFRVSRPPRWCSTMACSGGVGTLGSSSRYFSTLGIQQCWLIDAFHPTRASWVYSSVGGGAAAGSHGDASRVVNTLLDWPLVTRCFCRHLSLVEHRPRCQCVCNCARRPARGNRWRCTSHCEAMVCQFCVAEWHPLICHWCFNPWY